MGEVTQLLDLARGGDRDALERFYSRIYRELEVIAKSQLGRNAPMTLVDAPSLVNEVYLRISRQEALPGESRSSFFAYASSVMRSVIVDYLRARGAERRGGDQLRVTLNTNIEKHQTGEFDFNLLEAGLKSLQGVDERAYRVVEMRYFGGLEIEEIAQFLKVSPATIKRDWTRARMFLRHQLVNEARPND
jgi:RNA polymerase sigma factor (TIGR02999 family)